jgi:hypothetical protein
MQLIEKNRSTNPILIVLMLVLGLTAIFQNGFQHEIVYYSYLMTIPIAFYYLLNVSLKSYFSWRIHLPILIFLGCSALSIIWTINLNDTLSEL